MHCLLFVVAALVSQALAAAHVARQSNQDSYRCSGASNSSALSYEYHPYTAFVEKACYAKLAADGSNFWKLRSCVAAAVCEGPLVLVNKASCSKGPDVLLASAVPTLDTKVYASIVGECAKDECPVTVQNLVDLVYSELEAAKATVWPTSAEDLVWELIEPIFYWSQYSEADGIPLYHFDEFLHYSTYPEVSDGISYNF